MKLTLARAFDENAETRTFIWTPSEPLSWQAGQYLHYVLPHEHPDDRGIERWFTIAAAPYEGHVQITTRHSEKSSTFKEALFALPVGGTIDADTPEGDFVTPDADEPFVFIAGGIGITPFRAILLDRAHRGLPLRIVLLYANRDDQFVFKNELEALRKEHPEFEIHYVSGDERIDETLIRSCVPDIAVPHFYTSGPEPMVLAFEKMLADMGVPNEHAHRDDFPGYDWPLT